METLIIPRAHAAAITGLELLNASQPGLLKVVTAGLDQRLKVWDLHIDTCKPGVEGISIKRSCNIFTPVADVSGIALLDARTGQSALMVCGVGMDIWRSNVTTKAQ